MTITKISGQTINKRVKAEIKSQFPNATRLVKTHIAGVGYVSFIKNQDITLGKVFCERGKMIIYNDNKC